jgi:hypothetical protein
MHFTSLLLGFERKSLYGCFQEKSRVPITFLIAEHIYLYLSMFHMKQISKIKELRLSQLFFWAFLICCTWNKRIIYNASHAYIGSYFSYYLGFFLYLSDILFLVALVSFLVESRGISFSLIKNKFTWLVLGLIAVVLTGLFHVQQYGFWQIYSILKILEIIAAIWFVARETRIDYRIPVIILYITGLFQATLGIWQFHVQHMVGLSVLGEYLPEVETGGLATIQTSSGKLVRAYGTFPHPNILGFFLCLALILGYFLIVSRETSQKARNLIIFGDYLLIVGIFLTFSRISWLIAALASFSYLWYLKGSKKWLSLAIFLPALVSCGTILALWHGLLFYRVTNIETSQSYTQRVELNQAGIEIWKNNPILGVGVGNYIPRMQTMFNMQPWEYQPSHNIFIFVAASLGVVGLLFFLWILWLIFRSTWNAPESDWKFTLLVLGFSLLFVSLFDHFLVTIQQGQLMFAIILGLMIGYAHKT